MNYAYVTLLSSKDYLPAAIILDRNLKELNSQYPLYIMITNNIFDEVVEYLNKEQVHYIAVPVIEYSAETLDSMNHDTRLKTIASKINVFGLEDFEKVVYIDIDAIFLKTVDELFDYPDGSLYDDGGDRGFCGLFVCNPKMHPLNFYVSLLRHNCLWESNVIEELWFPFRTNQDYRIPFPYFVNIRIGGFDNLYPPKVRIFGLHFMGGHKPWKFRTPDEYRTALYTECGNESKTKDNLIQWYFIHYVEPLKKQYPELFK